MKGDINPESMGKGVMVKIDNGPYQTYVNRCVDIGIKYMTRWVLCRFIGSSVRCNNRDQWLEVGLPRLPSWGQGTQQYL